MQERDLEERARKRRETIPFRAFFLDGIIEQRGDINEKIPQNALERGVALEALWDLCSWLNPKFEEPIQREVATVHFVGKTEYPKAEFKDKYDLNVAKDRYHIAKLSLFKMRLLYRFEKCDKNSPIWNAINEEAEQCNVSNPILLNQAMFLEFAYICLVWLRESFKNSEFINEFKANYYKHLDNKIGLNSIHIAGERKVESWNNVLRLLRNAISHGRVEFVEGCQIKFSDIDEKNSEKNLTFLTITWENFALMSEYSIHSLTPFLFPIRA